MRPFVFISYSHADLAFAAEFAERLRSHGIDHFRDVEFIDWGEDIPDRVHYALEKATHLVVLISPGSEDSQWVAYEMGYAKGRKVIVVPYLLHPKMKLPGFISSLRYMQSIEDEKKFIESLKFSQPQTSIRRKSLTLSAATKEPALETQLRSSSGEIRRRAVIEMGESKDGRFVPLLQQLLNNEENENVRESAIKSLGKLGGEEAITTLERIWFGAEKSRFGKAAARNALKELGFWGKDKPILNPSALTDTFVSLQACRTDRDDKRDRSKQELLDEIRGQMRAQVLKAGYSLNEIDDLGASLKSEAFMLSWKVGRLQQQWYYRIYYSAEIEDIEIVNTIIQWSPTASDEIKVTTRDKLSFASAVERARNAGLDINLVLDDQIRISGGKWPGGITSEYSTLCLDVSAVETGTKIVMGRIPYGICAGWFGCVRLLIRLSRWLAAPD